MNITISKRAQSQREPTHKYKPKIYSYELQTRQKALTERKAYSVRVEPAISNIDQCSQWLFSKCFDRNQIQKTLNVNQKTSGVKQLKSKHCSLSSKPSHGLSQKKERQFKINVASNPTRRLDKGEEVRLKLLIQLAEKRQMRIPEHGFLNSHLMVDQKWSDILETKRGTEVHPSVFNSNTSSYEKITFSRKPDNSLKPSTLVSSGHNISFRNEINSERLKLTLSSQFRSVLATEIKINDAPTENDSKNLSINNYFSKEISSIHIEKNLHQNRELVHQSSSNDFKISDPLENKSINTDYLRRKIAFSEEKTDRDMLERYMYQPLFVVPSQEEIERPMTSAKKSKKNKSEFVNSIKVSQESEFNQQSMNSDESYVLKKGLIEIFNQDSIRRKLSNEDFIFHYDQSDSQLSSKHKKNLKQSVLQPLSDDDDGHWNNMYVNCSQRDEILQMQ